MEKIYYNGTILTMEEGKEAEAVLTKDGKIHMAGSLQKVRAAADGTVQMVDLKGCTMLPAFLDAHSHFLGAATAMLQASLEKVTNLKQLRHVLLEFMDKNKKKAGDWILARDFDHNQMEEKCFPTREFLDAIAPENPVVIQHKSGHMGVMNSLALKAAGVTADTPDPQGGRIGRDDKGLTGYLEEHAFLDALQKTPQPDRNQIGKACRDAQEMYASYGITTVQEGMLTAQMVPMHRQFAESGQFYLDVAAYGDWKDARKIREALKEYEHGYHNHLKLGGYKIFLDGSPQGRTAWMREPYEGSKDYKGYGTMDDEAVYQAVVQACEENMQLLAHCNGDAACVQYIKAIQRAQAQGFLAASIRPVMIHAQFLPKDYMSQVKACGILPSFFAAHVYYWGEVHLENMGRTRAQAISPARSALKAGVPFTFHQDTPVIAPNMLETVWCAVNRRTKEGRVLGEEERISPYEALKAVTIHAAYQYFEEDVKGSIRPGKNADFVILDKNPLQVPEMEIRRIQVLETIKEDRTIFSQ